MTTAKTIAGKITVELTLTEEEAVYLKGLTQNYILPNPGNINPKLEDTEDTVHRADIFIALEKALRIV